MVMRSTTRIVISLSIFNLSHSFSFHNVLPYIDKEEWPIVFVRCLWMKQRIGSRTVPIVHFEKLLTESVTKLEIYWSILNLSHSLAFHE
mmetsp:Transcript_1982/g.4662  ORF Transcript_1982/g.4662 Transcript_1982/m.4662 type:complete len:89 (+) Transcript_1982:340-606(+)